MASALAVADRFRELSGNTLTPLQLLKLVYIAHGWSFPIRKRGLISERIEAWQYGPVIPTLYQALKSFKAAPVNRPMVMGRSSMTEDDDALVQSVYEAYGHLSGGQLSALTHRPGTPWDIAWQRGKNSQITDEMISQHYCRINDERNGERA